MNRLILTVSSALCIASVPFAAPLAAPLAAQSTAGRSQANAARDSAASLVRAAQEAMRRNESDRAATLFRAVRMQYSASQSARDAAYWEAFNLQRLGGQSNLQRAATLLDEQANRFPDAASAADARALRVRIDGQLAQRGDASSARRLSERAESVAQNCPSADEDERLMVLDALLNMESARAVPTLKQVLARRDECSVALRRRAVFLVSRKRSAETEEILLNALRTDPDAEVRQQAVFWLGQTNSDKSTTVLLELIESSTDAELLGKAVFSLSQQRNERASTGLRNLAARKDLSTDLRGQAIFWLGQRSRAGGGAFLISLYPSLENELKERVLFGLSQQKSPEAQRFLLSVARDAKASTSLRSSAIFHAGQAGVSIADMLALFRSAEETDVREQIIFSISNQKSPESFDALTAIATTDKDRNMRAKAIFWIGQSKDPRRDAFLLSLLNK